MPGLGYRGSKDLDDLVPSKAAAGGPRCHGWLFFLWLVTAGYGWLRLVVEEWTIENESGGLTLITKSGFDMIEAPEIRISALTMRYPGVTMMWNQTIPATALANRCHEVACFPVEIEILVGLVG